MDDVFAVAVPVPVRLFDVVSKTGDGTKHSEFPAVLILLWSVLGLFGQDREWGAALVLHDIVKFWTTEQPVIELTAASQICSLIIPLVVQDDFSEEWYQINLIDLIKEEVGVQIIRTVLHT